VNFKAHRPPGTREDFPIYALVSDCGRYSVAKYPHYGLYVAWCGQTWLGAYGTAAEAKARCEADERQAAPELVLR
jgi:hypothetical protein